MNPSSHDSASLPSRLCAGVAMRLTWLAYLAAMAISSIGAFYSVIFMRADFLLGALVVGGMAWMARSALSERLEASRADGDIFDDEEMVGVIENEDKCDGRVSNLVTLLKEWECLERSRGSENFDPWAWQSARNEIRSAVLGDPKLERLFRSRD